MVDFLQQHEGLPKYLQCMREGFVAQIPKALWPLYEEDGEGGVECENPRFVVEYTYEIIGGHGRPMETSLGLNYFPKGADRPSFTKGRIVTLWGVDLLIISTEESEEVSEETGKPVAWFSIQVDLPESAKRSEHG